jgi:hypothetical protein
VKRASGHFEVKITPEWNDVGADAGSLGRMALQKQFHGALEGTSNGIMLTAGTSIKGSAGYVAIERFIGSLDSRQGSFVLQHNGTMNRGAPELTISVVPDSGTGQLTGLSGTMSIIIADGHHSYVLDYALAAASA